VRYGSRHGLYTAFSDLELFAVNRYDRPMRNRYAHLAENSAAYVASYCTEFVSITSAAKNLDFSDEVAYSKKAPLYCSFCERVFSLRHSIL